MSEPHARVHLQKQKDGKTQITVLDGKSGKVAHQYTTQGEQDVKKIKETLERAGNRFDVTDARQPS